MIKVNLLKSRVSAPEVEDYDFTEDASSSNSKILINLFVILICPIALYFYEGNQADILRAEQVKVNAQLAQIQQAISATRLQAGDTEKKFKEYQELETKIDLLKGLSKSRLASIKAMDYIQTIIPEKVWLSEINFSNEDMRISGFAVAETEFNDFLKSLEAKFRQVIVMKASQVEVNGAAVNSFLVTGKVEVVGQ